MTNAAIKHYRNLGTHKGRKKVRPEGMHYLRQCKRCDKIFRATSRGTKICDACRKPIGKVQHHGRFRSPHKNCFGQNEKYNKKKMCQICTFKSLCLLAQGDKNGK